MRPRRWSPEMSSRRSGWNRQTCEGAWPGVSITSQAPRSLRTSTPGSSGRVGSIGPATPDGPSRRARDHSSSGSGGTPAERGVSTRCCSTASGSRAARMACSWFGCIHTSHPDRSTIVVAWPKWSMCAWVMTSRRMCSRRRFTWLIASWRCAGEPGSCMPQSNKTTPWPDATAHALQCGTPGNGSGSRSRQTPGSTRSPRPTSRLRTEGAIEPHDTRPASTWDMGKRSRARGRAEKLEAPTSEYRSDTGDVLVLRGALTPKTRQEYAATFSGNLLSQEDAWQPAVEFLCERLAVRWEIAGVATEGQKALLMRFRVATQDERRFVRDTLREHAAEHFPELQAP